MKIHLHIDERPGTWIEVISDETGPAILVTDDNETRLARYTQKEGAKLGLAVLEAAGVEPYFPTDEIIQRGSYKHLDTIAGQLVKFTEYQERATAKAKEQAELEAEARDFYDAYHSAADWPYQDWVMLEERYKAQFLAVARKAREMRAEK